MAQKFSTSIFCGVLLLFITIDNERRVSAQNDLRTELFNLLLLQGPYAHNNPPVDAVTLALTKELFKDRALVEELVNCFDIRHNCKYQGLALMRDTLGEIYIPGTPCPGCPREMDAIVEYSQKQFQKRYKSLLQKFLLNVQDFFGGL